jgi:hypothetical protein
VQLECSQHEEEDEEEDCRRSRSLGRMRIKIIAAERPMTWKKCCVPCPLGILCAAAKGDVVL